MALGLLGLLFHAEHLAVAIEFDDACALELLDRGLLVTHDTRRAFGFGKVDELAKAEEQQVISCDDKHIVIDM